MLTLFLGSWTHLKGPNSIEFQLRPQVIFIYKATLNNQSFVETQRQAPDKQQQ